MTWPLLLKSGVMDMVVLLEAYPEDITAGDRYGNSCIHLAAFSADYDLVKVRQNIPKSFQYPDFLFLWFSFVTDFVTGYVQKWLVVLIVSRLREGKKKNKGQSKA